MFFDNTTPPPPPQGADPGLGSVSKLMAELKTEMSRFTTATLPTEALNEVYKLQKAVDGLNTSLLASRTRLVEMGQAITETAPGILSLGGDLKDVQSTLAEIAAGSRRNIIATTKDAQELFAVGELTGKKVTEIVDGFSKVGMSYKKIGENVKDTINTANSLGLNARAVMESVVANTDKLQRYNFEGGVKGLTRMAAQASMLRFDMSETFKLAEDVLNPDRAVEVASAFQRLGVSAGNLVDPFQLMNQSINDPAGLQDSLINISKQFTYFDEKTKTYKINPQGILTLKEIENQTKVSSKALMDAAISAADFDERLAAVSKAKLFPEASEDDKKLIANMARMGDKGEYEIAIGGEYKKISELNSNQLKELVEQQKKGPQTVEEIQRATLDIDKALLSNAREINQKLSKTLLFSEKGVENSLEFTKAIRETGKETAAAAFPKDLQDTLKNLREQRRIAKEAGDQTKVSQIDTSIRQFMMTNMRGSLNQFQQGIKDMGEVGSENFGKMLDKIVGTFADVTFGKSTQSQTRGARGGSTPQISSMNINAPSNQVNPEWIYGVSQKIQQAAASNQTQQQVKVDTSDIPALPKRIEVFFNKPASVDFSSIEEALSSGILKIEEATFNAVEKTAKRLGKTSRLP